jgi:prepilin-type N-terminal cleavage/methylation domain-containing protein
MRPCRRGWICFRRGLGAVGRDERGFTLSELLVSIAVLGTIMAAVMGVHVLSNKIFLTGENRATVQEAARAAMLMEEDLRLAGQGCPTWGCSPNPVAPCGTPANPISVTAASPTSITFWADLLNASTTLTAAVSAGNTTFTVANGSNMQAGNGVFLIIGNQAERLVLTAATAGAVIVGAPGAACSYPVGAQVTRPRAVIYTVAGGTLTKDAGDGAGAQIVATGLSNCDAPWPAATLFRYFDQNDAEIAAANLAANLGNIRRLSVCVRAQSAGAQNTATFSISSNVRPRDL